jgi:signal transduction histidine kinase
VLDVMLPDMEGFEVARRLGAAQRLARRPDRDRVFERFWRAEGGRERGKSGAGLGLAIVSGIVGAHGGHVAAANANGGGAAFVVTLPAARA